MSIAPQPLRIAHFIQRYPPALGGSEAYFQRLSRFLSARGHFVSVWTTTAVDLEAFWNSSARSVGPGIDSDKGVEVRRYSPKHWPLRRYMLKAASFLPHRTIQAMMMPCNPIAWNMWRDAVRQPGAYDVVHASAFPYAWPIVCARRLARRLSVPFFLTPFLHLGSPDDKANRTRRQYLAKPLRSLLLSADGVFVQTPSEREAALDSGVPAERIVLQGLGVDPAECTGGDRLRGRAEWGLSPNGIVVGHLANLSYEKGTIDLLQAARKSWERGAEFELLLAGPAMTNFRDFWPSFGQQGRVRITGVLDERQKRDFFASIDLFALPSRSDSFGLVLLEAWANGRPNLAYRAGGIADVVRHDDDGILVRCGDIDGIAHELGRLANDSSLRDRLGSAGQRRVLSRWAWTDKLELVERTYRRLGRN